MKLEHGKSYKRGIIILFLVWALFSVLPLPNSPDNPALLGFALSVLGVVAYQAYSGVALDQFWRASISARINKMGLLLRLFSRASLLFLPPQERTSDKRKI